MHSVAVESAARVRGLSGSVTSALDSVKVVVLEGGRSVGKTTLARQIAAARSFPTSFDLSDPTDRAQLEWSPTRAQIFHWRDSKARREVDLVLRRDDGSLIGIEVKSAGSVDTRDTQGLRAFVEHAGDAVTRCVILYTGRTVAEVGENIWAVPVSSLF